MAGKALCPRAPVSTLGHPAALPSVQVAVSKATSIQFLFLAEDTPGGQPLGVQMLTLRTGCLSPAAPGTFL